MFDIGFWELLLIAVVALIVVGPERLPKLVRTTGLWIGRAQASFNAIKSEINKELREEELRQALKTDDLPNLNEIIRVDDTPNHTQDKANNGN